MPEGYCLKEKKKVEIKDPERVILKNGRKGIRGICPDCGGKIFRMGGMLDEPAKATSDEAARPEPSAPKPEVAQPEPPAPKPEAAEPKAPAAPVEAPAPAESQSNGSTPFADVGSEPGGPGRDQLTLALVAVGAALLALLLIARRK